MNQLEHGLYTEINYYFLRSKDVHIENQKMYITLFARLTREITTHDAGTCNTCIHTLWVDIDELPYAQAPLKVQRMPNCVRRFTLTEEVFENILQVTTEFSKDLFYITPYHKKSTYQKLVL